jgi:malonyl-CoA/methylmalonyl-CoA synthetase
MASATLPAALLSHAAHTPHAPAVIWQGATLTYAHLAAQSAGWAQYYAQQGVARGDRVGLYVSNSPTFLSAYLGAHLAGAAVVLINTQYRAGELQHILSDSAARLVVTDATGREHLGQAQCSVPTVDAVDPPPADIYALTPPAPHELALLAYTSGTTGRAKGAMHTHAGLLANSAAVTAAWHWTNADRLLLVLPLFHIHGLGVGVHGTLLTGASLDLRPRFDAVEVLDALQSGAISMFFGVPTMYTRLIAEARGRTTEQRNNGTTEQRNNGTTEQRNNSTTEQQHNGTTAQRNNGTTEQSVPLFSGSSVPLFSGSSVRLFVSGSAPLTPQTFAEFQELFGQAILERYGMTETVMNLTNPYAGERRPGSVGMPFPGQEARIVAVRTREPLPDGAIGEIEVRGPHVCTGYWRNPAATAEVFHTDGWFSTGDLGFRAPDGYFTITGRAKELIISGGYNVYPREVEEMLLQHPAVAECAVYGMADADLGERVAAAVVLRPEAGLTPDEATAALSAFCREQLAAYKLPRLIRYVDLLPRNALGKVQKHLLQEGQPPR